MAEPVQTYQNHTRFFPLFHFVAAPILLVNFLVAAWRLYRAPTLGTAWGVVFAFGLVAALLAARLMALTVQDRVIRLEMQLRLARLLAPDLLEKAVACGLRSLFVGFETTNADNLHEQRKVQNIRRDYNAAVKRLLRELPPDPPAAWGTIKGQVVLPANQQVPQRKKLEVSQDKEHCLSKGDILDESLVPNHGTKEPNGPDLPQVLDAIELVMATGKVAALAVVSVYGEGAGSAVSVASGISLIEGGLRSWRRHGLPL